MRRYEGIFIVKPDLNEEEIKKVVAQITELITKSGGHLEDSQIWNKRQLSYEIDKKKSGVYILTHFNIKPTTISKLKKSYNLDGNILKALIIKQ